MDVVLTRSAQEFIGAVTFEALTGRPVHTALIEAGHALDHIRLARAADAVVVAPATADFLARSAGGRADDLLGACLLATTAPVLVVPAMNDRMWSHPQTARNVAHLRALGTTVLEPETGELAAGEGSGPGRMPEPETILAHVGRLLERSHFFRGRRVVVTAGPTREAMDPVRFISNRSSGKMGYAVAAAARQRGAAVVLVSGPTSLEPPPGVEHFPVTTAADMREAVLGREPWASVVVMTAAVADYRAANPARQKIKKGSGALSLTLEQTSDILSEVGARRRAERLLVGFAAETERGIEHARRKLREKHLDLIVLNDVSQADAGFDVDTNRVWLIGAEGEAEGWPLLDKEEVAARLMERVAAMRKPKPKAQADGRARRERAVDS